MPNNAKDIEDALFMPYHGIQIAMTHLRLLQYMIEGVDFDDAAAGLDITRNIISMVEGNLKSLSKSMTKEAPALAGQS